MISTDDSIHITSLVVLEYFAIKTTNAMLSFGGLRQFSFKICANILQTSEVNR